MLKREEKENDRVVSSKSLPTHVKVIARNHKGLLEGTILKL